MQAVFTIYDSKSETFANPLVLPNSGVAMRTVARTALDLDHDFSKFGADYTLFEIGTFDPESGFIDMHDAKINHGTALEILRLMESCTPAPRFRNGVQVQDPGPPIPFNEQ